MHSTFLQHDFFGVRLNGKAHTPHTRTYLSQTHRHTHTHTHTHVCLSVLHTHTCHLSLSLSLSLSLDGGCHSDVWNFAHRCLAVWCGVDKTYFTLFDIKVFENFELWTIVIASAMAFSSPDGWLSAVTLCHFTSRVRHLAWIDVRRRLVIKASPLAWRDTHLEILFYEVVPRALRPTHFN